MEEIPCQVEMCQAGEGNMRRSRGRRTGWKRGRRTVKSSGSGDRGGDVVVKQRVNIIIGVGGSGDNGGEERGRRTGRGKGRRRVGRKGKIRSKRKSRAEAGVGGEVNKERGGRRVRV